MTCKECGKPFAVHFGTTSTLMGYFYLPGHNHDDNCQKRIYRCEDGHDTCLSIIPRCPLCDWRGKDSCFCSTRVDAWPKDVPQANTGKAYTDEA